MQPLINDTNPIANEVNTIINSKNSLSITDSVESNPKMNKKGMAIQTTDVQTPDVSRNINLELPFIKVCFLINAKILHERQYCNRVA